MSNSRSDFFSPRALLTLLLCAAGCSAITGTLLVFCAPEVEAKLSNKTLTFTERVAYQKAIEQVYWRHRIWPKERPEPKPSLDAVMSQAQLEKKVEDYLRNSQALEDYWQRPLTAEQLQAEMDRMAKHTKQPDVLRELFEALGNDPFIIAECLARPILSGRLATNLYARDQRFHHELRKRAEADLQAHRTVGEMKKTSRIHREIELVNSDDAQGKDTCAKPDLKLSSREWDQHVQKLAATFDGAKDGTARPKSGHDHAGAPVAQIKTGLLSALQEDSSGYYATAVIERAKNRLKLAKVAWLKEPFESWRARAEDQVPNAMAAQRGNYTLPIIADGTGSCIDDTWTVTSIPPNLPDARSVHTAVWTGSEMIIWGGEDDLGTLNTGARYNPSTESWAATSTTNAPEARALHTAVWSGSEMIVWGGRGDGLPLNTGGK